MKDWDKIFEARLKSLKFFTLENFRLYGIGNWLNINH